jgi:hypothetical protein
VDDDRPRPPVGRAAQGGGQVVGVGEAVQLADVAVDQIN